MKKDLSATAFTIRDEHAYEMALTELLEMEVLYASISEEDKTGYELAQEANRQAFNALGSVVDYFINRRALEIYLKARQTEGLECGGPKRGMADVKES